jgi:hypothetical protein
MGAMKVTGEFDKNLKNLKPARTKSARSLRIKVQRFSLYFFSLYRIIFLLIFPRIHRQDISFIGDLC